MWDPTFVLIVSTTVLFKAPLGPHEFLERAAGCPPPALTESEKGEVLLRGVGILRYSSPTASVQWQPDDVAIHTNKWFLGAGFLGAPPILLLNIATSRHELPAYTDSIRTVLLYIYIYIYILYIGNYTILHYIYIYIYIYT